ncbi:MAG: 4Fe-4S binding protein [Verrucomicrobiota bacterium]
MKPVANRTRRWCQAIALLLFLALLLYVCWPYGGTDYNRTLQQREQLPAELFLWLDPLLGLSAALAAKLWLPALAWAGGLLLLSLWLPRMFCGYLCPLGTLIDLADSLTARLPKRWRVNERGGWIHLKYYLLVAVLVAACFGVLLSGFLAAIPVVTRGLQFILGPLELGILKGWYLIPAFSWTYYLSLGLFFVVLGLGVLSPRFWCRYVCPTGALFSLGNLLRLRERKVTDACVDCGKCAPVCPFDAIQPDQSTRGMDCTVCETCATVCPTQAIQFKPRWQPLDRAPVAAPMFTDPPVSRRGFLCGALGGAASAALIPAALNANGELPVYLVRPPGSVPEDAFLQLCIRCGACFQACPNNALQPAGLRGGLNALWTPELVARWSGCEPSCARCGQVCPTLAIRSLPLAEKKAAHIGLAVLDLKTCLPYAGKDACQLCVDECKNTGYDAIEFQRVGTETDAAGNPVADSGFLAPRILPDKCVGCGLCETRCHKINVQHRGLLRESAIRVEAGPGKEDRIFTGSYRTLRAAEQQQLHPARPTGQKAPNDGYLPDFLK